MRQNSAQYLELFFEEKEIGYEIFEIEHAEQLNFISTDTVIDLIMQASSTEQKTIADTLRKIDFMNGDVKHYLKHLAKCYIMQQTA